MVRRERARPALAEDSGSVRDPRQRGDAAADAGRARDPALRGVAFAVADGRCAGGRVTRGRDRRLAGARLQPACRQPAPRRMPRRRARLARRSDGASGRRPVHRRGRPATSPSATMSCRSTSISPASRSGPVSSSTRRARRRCSTSARRSASRASRAAMRARSRTGVRRAVAATSRCASSRGSKARSGNGALKSLRAVAAGEQPTDGDALVVARARRPRRAHRRRRVTARVTPTSDRRRTASATRPSGST